jgi:hypothetical protein
MRRGLRDKDQHYDDALTFIPLLPAQMRKISGMRYQREITYGGA